MTQTITLTLAALTTIWNTPTEDPQITGYATYSHKMAEVAYNLGYIPDQLLYQEWLDSQGLVGAVALNRKADKDRHVWIAGPQGIEGPFLAIDCAQLRHFRRQLELGRIVEVDLQTATR